MTADQNLSMLNNILRRTVATIAAAYFFMPAFSQANLPYTLNFTGTSTAAWADGIAQDGDGGTMNINGIDVQIYAANSTTFAVLPGSTMRWFNNSYYISGSADYTGITPGPDPDITINGFPAMVIKSTNTANNFSLVNIRLYDWGGWPTTKVSTYDNGVLKGSINVNFDEENYTATTLTNLSGLPATIFQNIDEIRFVPVGQSFFWLSMNNIGLSSLGVLPVNLSSFNAALQDNRTTSIKWTAQQAVNTAFFNIEHSTDGINYSSIGKVMVNSTTSQSAYNFNTGTLEDGRHFYRLKIVDADGSCMYSAVEIISVSSKAAVSIYPNPVKNVAQVTANGSIIRQVKIYSASGSLLAIRQVNAKSTTIDLTGMSSGTYYIEVVIEKNTFHQALIKE